jgi:hypothetical protein
MPCPVAESIGSRGSMSNPDDSTLARRAGGALDAANVLLADLRDGLGPYLAIYLLAEQKWD